MPVDVFGINRMTISVPSLGDVTELLLHKRFTIKLTTDGYSGELVFDFTGIPTASIPAKGAKFTLTLPSGQQLVLVARKLSKVEERYPNQAPFWIHIFRCVDPITALANRKLPLRKSYLNTTTGAILVDLISQFDPALNTAGVTAGNDVASLNLRDFSSFGDLLRSEIMSGGYVLRMGAGLNVQGKFSNLFSTTEFRVDFNDYRYTPLRQDIEPPDEVLDSVTVIPTKQVPIYRVSEYHEIDGRAFSQINLQSKPLGLEDAEPLKLGAGIDVNDTLAYDVSGIVTTSPSHILLNGTLTLLEARPFVFPFVTDWVGIRATQSGASFRVGFTDDTGAWLLYLDSLDFGGLSLDTQFDQHVYGGYAAPQSNGSINVWSLHLHQNFQADTGTALGTITNVNTGNNQITLDTPWIASTDFIKITNSTGATERGRKQITRKSQDGLVLTLESIPPGTVAGDKVFRGVSAEQTLDVALVRTVSPIGPYGLPTLEGVGVAIESFIVQRIGQIEGKLLSESNPNPNSTYPRDLQIEVDVSERSDAQISGSGSSGVVTFARKFSTAPRVEVLFNYVVGGKRVFDSICGSADGDHINVNVDNEQDPDVLQAQADRICTLGNIPTPTVVVPIESSETPNTPLPYDLLPVVLPTEYRLPSGDIPIEEVEIKYGGGTDSADLVIYSLTAGNKSAADRVKEEFLRGSGFTRYPIRIATISGVTISSVSWDGNILTAFVSGTVYGPHGEVLDLASGVNPAEVMGIPDPAAVPVVLRGTVPTARPVPDIVIFQVVYPPAGVNPASLTTRIHIKTRQAEWMWTPASGALKYNIFRRKTGATGETDADLELVDTVVSPASTYIGPVSKDNRDIYVQSVGLCDKTSSKIKLTCSPARLSAPGVAFLRLKDDNVTKIITTDPPEEALDIIFVTSPNQTGFTVADGIPIPTQSDPNAGLVHIQVQTLTTDPSNKNHYLVSYDATKAGQDFYLTAAWRNFFEEPQDWSTPINPNALKSARPEKPPKPRLLDLEVNEPNLETIESDANISIRVHADGDYLIKPSQNWLTFDAANSRGVKIALRRVKVKDRTISGVGASNGWTNPLNAQKSDDLRATAAGTGSLSAQVLIGGSPVGSLKSQAITGEADQIYVFGGPGDFWGASFATFATSAFEGGTVGIRLVWGALTQDYTFPSFNPTPTGTIHGFMLKVECRVVSSVLETDCIIGACYFSRAIDDVVEKYGGGDFEDDSLAFAKEALLQLSLKFSSCYWIQNYMNCNGKLKTPSDDSDPDVVFQAGAQTAGITPTITSVTAVDGDQQMFRATFQFTQTDPPAPISVATLKRKKGSGRFKRIGEPLDMFGKDEYLASGLREAFIDFQALDGVTDYSLIVLLTTIQGIDRQSAQFAFTTTKKQTGDFDAAAPQVPVLKRAFFKKGKSIIVVVDQPTADINITSIHDYGFAFFFPQGAAVGSRTYFNPDTGASLGTSPTFGRSGTAEFFTGGSKRFQADILKVELPAGAVSGGIGVLCRAYNYTLDINGNKVETTSAAFPGTSQIAAITSFGTDPQVQDAAAPGPVQNLNLIYTEKKGHKATWGKPLTNILSLKGYFVVYFNDISGNLFMNAVTGAVSVPNTEATAEFFIADTQNATHLKRSQMDAFFVTNGVKVKVTPVNVVNDVETRGTPTTFGSNVIPSVADPAAGDTGPPGQPAAPTVQEYYGDFMVEAVPPATNANTIAQVQIVMSESGIAPAGDPIVGLEGVVKIRRSTGPVSFKRKTSAAPTVFFYCRFQNTFTTTWSLWSPGTSVTGTTIRRPLDDVIGTDVITLPTVGDTGFTNFDQTGLTGGTPMVVSLDSDTNELVIQFINPTNDPNGYSFTDIELQIKKKGNGVIKYDTAIKATDGAVVRIPYPTTYTPSVRCRYKNQFRDATFVYTDPGADKAKGWSAWSKYVVDFQHTIAPGGGITPQGGDFQSQASRPDPYTNY